MVLQDLMDRGSLVTMLTSLYSYIKTWCLRQAPVGFWDLSLSTMLPSILLLHIKFDNPIYLKRANSLEEQGSTRLQV